MSVQVEPVLVTEPDLVWRLCPASTPLCTDCGGTGQVRCPEGGSTWCRLCDASGVLPTEVMTLTNDGEESP